MNKKVVFLIIVLMLQTVVCLAQTNKSAAMAEEFEFRFNPPDGLIYKTTATSVNKKSSGFGRKTEKAVIESAIKIEKTDSGYTFFSAPMSLRIFQDDEEILNPVADLLVGNIVSIEVDNGGNVVSLKGYEKIEEKIKEKFTADMVRTLSTIINVDRLSNKATEEWNRHIKDYVGRRVRIGDSWADKEEYIFPDGKKVVYFVVIKIKEVRKCGQDRCIKIQYNYNTDVKKMGIVSDDVENELAYLFADTDSKYKPEGVTVSGKGDKLIDPNTMIVYSENILKTVKRDIEIDGIGKKQTVSIESRYYETEFDD